MCVICDGLSQDEALFDLECTIARHGWALQYVEPDPSSPGWVYTIGLTDFDHPELVMAGSSGERGAILNDLGERVRRGERFAVGDSVEVLGVPLSFGEVHPAQAEQGLVNSWFHHYEAPGRPTPDLQVLQVCPERCTCRTCGLRFDTPEWVLDEAGGSPGRTARPNRAIRRAGARARARQARAGGRPGGTPGYRPTVP